MRATRAQFARRKRFWRNPFVGMILLQGWHDRFWYRKERRDGRVYEHRFPV